jgi:ketopantoate hydroxymethyltransferase
MYFFIDAHGCSSIFALLACAQLYHCKSVARGASRSLLVGDMPFGTYEVSEQVAYDNAIRFLKEGSMEAVKLEGGRMRAKTVQYVGRRSSAQLPPFFVFDFVSLFFPPYLTILGRLCAVASR